MADKYNIQKYTTQQKIINPSNKIIAKINWSVRRDGAILFNPFGLRYSYCISARYYGRDCTREVPAGKYLLHIVDINSGLYVTTFPKIGGIKYLKACALKHYRHVILSNLSQCWLNWCSDYLTMEAKAS